jgi:hypothetical protein
MKYDIPVFSDLGIPKDLDLLYRYDREVANLDTTISEISADVEATGRNLIIRGLAAAQLGSPSMAVQIGHGSLYSAASRQYLQAVNDIGPVSVADSADQDRYDTLEIRQLVTPYSPQNRKFRSAAAGTISLQSVMTKSRYAIEARTMEGIAGAGIAPAQSSGWTKIAEIKVRASSTSILNADISNVVAGYDGEANTWTNQPTLTFRHGSAKYNKAMFRAKHLETGDHGANVIRGQHLLLGTGSDEIDADLLPLGTAVTSTPTGGTATSLANTSFVRAALAAIFARLIDLSGAGNDAAKNRHFDFGLAATQIKAGDIPMSLGAFASTDVESALQELAARLRTVGTGKGASLIGVQDAGGYFADGDSAVDTVEQALLQIATMRVGRVDAFVSQPAGRWLFCDGSTIDKSVNPQYALLVDRLRAEVAGDATHPYYDANANRAKLPDARGLSIRGVDTTGATRDKDGRRKSGSYQDSSVLNHTHGDTTTPAAGNHTHTASEADTSDVEVNTLRIGAFTNLHSNLGYGGTHTHPISVDQGYTHRTGHAVTVAGLATVESVGRTVALYPYISY